MKRHPALLLVVGTLLLAAAHLRFGIGLLAWVAPVPFLLHARWTSGWRQRVLLGVVLVVAWSVAVVKIATDPIPVFMAPLYGIPLGVAQAAAMTLGEWLRRRRGGWLGLLAWPAAAVCAEWALFALTPLGSWGAAAYTQLDHLALLQVASLVGLTGVSALVYGVAAVLAEAMDGGPVRRPA